MVTVFPPPGPSGWGWSRWSQSVRWSDGPDGGAAVHDDDPDLLTAAPEPITSQYSGHVISIDQSEASIAHLTAASAGHCAAAWCGSVPGAARQ